MLRYAVTIFLGAFLLFLVQPLIGKFILPWFGGGPGVWTTCMVLFQILLLIGYAYAHAVTRWLSRRMQMVLHLALLAIALAFLPIVPNEAWKPNDAGNPTARILLLLIACIGVPFTALSATGPLLQVWFNRTHLDRSPYRLYALSNAGSMLALLCYPFVLEPALSRKAQAMVWTGMFIAFELMCGYCAVRFGKTKKQENVDPQRTIQDDVQKSKRRGNKRESARTKRQSSIVSRQSEPRPQPSRITCLLWLLLPACASVLLLAVTSKITTDIAPIPFLWILPLAIYLLTFIFSFEWSGVYSRPAIVTAFLVSVLSILASMLIADVSIFMQAAAFLVTLFACCMICHGELYRLRPPAERLTSFYLCIAAGGAVGGAFVSLAAPLLFTRNVEFYLSMFGSIALLMACVFYDAASVFHRGARRQQWLIFTAIMLACGFAMTLAVRYLEQDTVLWTRNFYGSLRITSVNRDKKEGQYLTLEHGAIGHGLQILDNRFRKWPTMYYGFNTGIGLVMRNFPKKSDRHVGVVGLGVGTVACYGLPGDSYRFYEINPEVERLARTYFSFISDSIAHVDVVQGDARLSLEREAPNHFDILVLDAFNGDAIPVHLLTREAFEIYVRHLDPDGVIAVHVSNRYLDLHPIVHRLALEFGLETVFLNTAKDQANFVVESQWVIVTKNQAVLNHPLIKDAGDVPQGRPHVSLWTDDHASLLEVLR